MKSIFKKIASTFSLLIIGVAIGISGLAMANENLTLEEQIGQLTLTLQEIFVPQEQQGQDDILNQPQQAGGDGTHFPPSYICTFDYQEWPSSDTYKESDWAMEDMYSNPTASGNETNYIDINGDGLVDYFYLQISSDTRRSCIQLNTGRGWEDAHKCYAKMTNNVWTFYGDCALQ